MKIRILVTAFAAVLPLMPSPARAQDAGIAIAEPGWHAMALAQGGQPGGFIFAGSSFEILDASPLESEKTVKDAPFTADAVTEFVQTLSDGNRIERNFRASIARDSRGRTRREEQIALLGPLSAQGDPPTMITINDPEGGMHYTLNGDNKTARRERFVYRYSVGKGVGTGTATGTGVGVGAGAGVGAQTFTFETKTSAGVLGNQIALGGLAEKIVPESSAVIENLGTQRIEGVEADGTRTTTRIPAGAIGNQLPIDIVSERWFSKELGLAVLITRRDPRSGDTTYRLTNIVRAEPSPDLFTVPRDYQIDDVGQKLLDLERRKIESKPILVK